MDYGQFGNWTGDSAFGGSVTKEHLEELIKAIEAGNDTAAGGANETGFALRPQSLDGTLKMLTFRDEHVVAWKDTPKSKAYSTVEEYNRLESYGDEALSAFAPEGELPFAEDSTYSRQLAKIKFLGTLRAVSHPMGLVTPAHGDVIDRENQNGTLWMMRQIEMAQFFGDSSINPMEFDGWAKQITDGAAANVIDMKDTVTGLGQSVDPQKLDEVSEQVYGLGNYGKLSHCYWSTKQHRAFSNTVLGSQATENYRKILGDKETNLIRAGVVMKEFDTNFGLVQLRPDVFLTPRSFTAAQLNAGFAKGDSTKRPGVPGGAAVLGAGGTGGLWGSANDGVFKYIAVAVNAWGYSNGSVVSASAAVDDPTKKITFTVTDNPGSVATTGYVIYRTKTGGADLYYEVARIAKTGATDDYVDINQNVAGTSKAFAMTMDPQIVTFRQLAPFTRIPLAQIDLRTRWVQVLYGTPLIFQPKKCILFKNVLES